MGRRFQYPRHYVGKKKREGERGRSSTERPGGIATESEGGFSCEMPLGHSSIITLHSLSLSPFPPYTKKKQSVVSCGSPVNETPSRRIVIRLSTSSSILSVRLIGLSLQRTICGMLGLLILQKLNCSLGVMSRKQRTYDI
jgi:hypothetical protein